MKTLRKHLETRKIEFREKLNVQMDILVGVSRRAIFVFEHTWQKFYVRTVSGHAQDTLGNNLPFVRVSRHPLIVSEHCAG
jgi:hypothetical protein